MNTHPIILALDASSTSIGYCVYGGHVIDSSEIKLTGNDIAQRCRQAYAALGLILEAHSEIDVIAIEAPVARFAKAVIPQARVSGALFALAGLRDINIIEISPTEAKRALTGKGNADKHMMQAAAAAYDVTGEHAADALGVALAAVPRVVVVAQVAGYDATNPRCEVVLEELGL
jgi:Holliday junction resolvasome RuvABC endonuclease subunit